jgi:hypothetical protein
VQMVTCQRTRYVTECYRRQVPYTTCRMVPEVCTRYVPRTTCHLEAYCEKYQVCRMVPYCQPVCEQPACPCVPTACGVKSKWHAFFASKLSGGACCGQ